MPSNISDRLIAILERQPKKRNVDWQNAPRKLTDEQRDQLARHASRRPLLELEIMREARDRLAQGWVAHEIAVDDHGQPTSPDSPRACKWCMSGAIQAAAYQHGAASTGATHSRIKRVARQVLYVNLGRRGFTKSDPIITLASLNDKIIESKEEALEMFNKAIRHQEQICREKGLL